MHWTSAAPLPRRIAAHGTALVLLALPTGAAAQRSACSALRPMVDGVEFAGNRAIPTGDLAPIIVTERTGLFRRWFGWGVGPLTCLDSVEVGRDARRLELQYARRGYPGTRATPRITRHGRDRARVTFVLREAPPVLVRDVMVEGLPADAADSAALRRRLAGRMLDSSVFAVADSMFDVLRNAGYARAQMPRVDTLTDTTARAARVRLSFSPGRPTYIGSIDVRITPSGREAALRPDDVRALLRLRSGERFSAQRVDASHRELYALALYRSIRLDTVAARESERATAGAPGADTIPLFVSLVEGNRRRLRLSGGWGTLDCLRAQGRLLEQNFLGAGHRLEVSGRLSKIGLSDPFRGADGLCAPRVRDDPFSQNLNFHAGATVNVRGVLGVGLRPELTVFSERRSQVGAYEQTTDIGLLAAITREPAPGLEARLQYSFVDGRTRTDRVVSCSTFGLCRLEDVASFLLRSPLHGAGVTVTKSPLLPTDDPVVGQRWRVEAKYGHASIGRTLPLDFARFTGEVALYRPLSWLVTAAMRLQLGAIVAPADRSFLLPPPERFYAGGQNTVRGYGQNLLGPGSYIVSSYDTVTGSAGAPVGEARPGDGFDRIAPSGGNAMWLANLELRTTRGWPRDLLRWVLFVDAGRVWNTRDVFSVTNAGARVTPGLGVRLVTPLGPFRVDAGYNPNSFEPGPAFYVQPGDLISGVSGRAICVSRGSDDPLVLAPGQTPSAASCPATFLPAQRGGPLSRLVFHFSLGNAF